MEKRKKIIILGTGGFASELYHLVESYFEVSGFIGPIEKDLNMPAPFLGDDSKIDDYGSEFSFLIAVGEIRIRKKIFNKLVKKEKKIESFIHQNSYVYKNFKIPSGLLVYPNSSIHANVILGESVVVNSNCTIGHDTKIGNFVNINPGTSIGGNCIIENEIIIGIGSSILNDIKIQNNIVIGGGALVSKDLKAVGVYKGVPAKIK